MKRILYVIGIFCILVNTVSASPKIEQWQTKNGVRTLFVAAPELPIIDIELTFDAGSARDRELSGLSQLTHSLLNAGSGELDADAIAEKFEDVGAQFGVSINVDRSSVSLRSLSDEQLFNQALSTFITVLTQPSFPEKDFIRLKNQALIAIKDEEQRPGNIASKAFNKAIYGDHPYAQTTLGNRDSINKISIEDVKKFQQRYLVTDNALIAIVGGIDKKLAKRIANKISAKLRNGKKPEPIPKPNPNLPAEDIYVPYPSQQAHVHIGQLGIRRGEPDYFILYAGNHVLGGGGFTSRLVKEVRVERGLSYSVYSYFLPMQLPGPFLLGLQTKVEQAKEASDVSLKTIEQFIAEGPTDEELTLAKNNIIGGFPLRIDNNRDILGYLSMIGYYNMPLDYLDSFTDKISAVTKQDIQDAFKRHLNLNNMTKIIVGGQE